MSIHSVLAGPTLFPACPKTHGSEFTPSPEYHHSHPDRPQPAAGAGHPRCHPGRPRCCPGPLLTAHHSRRYTPHVTARNRLNRNLTGIHHNVQVRGEPVQDSTLSSRTFVITHNDIPIKPTSCKKIIVHYNQSYMSSMLKF